MTEVNNVKLKGSYHFDLESEKYSLEIFEVVDTAALRIVLSSNTLIVKEYGDIFSDIREEMTPETYFGWLVKDLNKILTLRHPDLTDDWGEKLAKYIMENLTLMGAQLEITGEPFVD